MIQPTDIAMPATPAIYRMIQYIEWTSLILVAIVLTSGAAGYASNQSLQVALVSLSSCALLSGVFPSDRPLWQRRLYITLEVIVLLPTRLATGWNLEIFLYIILAKSCFLLSRKDVIITVILTGIAWQLSFAISFPWRLPEMIESVQAHLFEYLNHPQEVLIAELINGTGSYLAASLFVLLFSFVLIAEQRSRQRAITLTKKTESLAAALERTRIARDIHDSLGHTLTALDIQLELAQELYEKEPRRALAALNSARELSTQSLTNVRQAVHTMRYENFDLNQALMALINQFRQHHTYNLEYSINLPSLPLQISYQLYCVIQEGLTNIQKHSHATAVSLRSFVAHNAVTLELRDDGQGFDLESDYDGFGLRGMQERVQLLGGEFKIETAPGKGTCIRVKIET